MEVWKMRAIWKAVAAAGFGELGDEGVALQARLARTAAESGIAVIGPNCSGFKNVPLDVFLELAMVVDFIHVDYDESSVNVDRFKAVLQEEEYPVESATSVGCNAMMRSKSAMAPQPMAAGACQRSSPWPCPLVPMQ